MDEVNVTSLFDDLTQETIIMKSPLSFIQYDDL